MPKTHAQRQKDYRERHPEYAERENLRKRILHRESARYREQTAERRRRYMMTAKGFLRAVRANAKRRGS